MQTVFIEDSYANSQIENFVNGYLTLNELLDEFKTSLVIGKLRKVLIKHKGHFLKSEGINRIGIKLTIDCITASLAELETKYPEDEYPELWI